jgi:hypothetical protein
MDAKLRFDKNIFEVDDVNDLSVDELKSSLDADSFACIRNLVKPKEVELAVQKLKTTFDPKMDHATVGESPKDIQENFQKLLVGGITQDGLYLTRFFRTFYNPMWSADIYGMHDIYKRMIRVRNLLGGLPQDFALNEIESNGLWSATRIHQYPLGGGYFTGHRDVVLIDVSKTAKTEFYQVILNMTKKGRDFEKGGAYIEKDNKRTVFDELFEVGDIVIYDERTFHGVEEIDSHRVVDLSSINGRLVAFVSLYKDMK